MGDLSKFGVPLDGVKQGMLQPRMAYRFRVIFNNFGTNNNLRELTANVQSVVRPAITHEEAAVHSYNSIAYVMGKHAWQPIDLVVRDDITGAIASAVYSQVQRQMNHYEQIGPVAGTNYKFGMQIHTLDGTNAEELESWELTGCFLTNVDYSEADYSVNDFVSIQMTIRYDNATHYQGDNNLNGRIAEGQLFDSNPIVDNTNVNV